MASSHSSHKCKIVERLLAVTSASLLALLMVMPEPLRHRTTATRVLVGCACIGTRATVLAVWRNIQETTPHTPSTPSMSVMAV